MNILSTMLPKSVTIEGVEYAVNTDFRTFLNFESIIEDKELEEEEKILKTLELFYPVIPRNISEAIDKMLWFYSCDIKEKENKGTKKAENKKIYSFEYDADYIYSDFLKQYNIDLQEINLHWWKFRTLFNGLDENSQIKKIMSYRAIDLKDVKDNSQKDFYKKMKEIYKLPNSEKEEKILDETLQMLMKYQ